MALTRKSSGIRELDELMEGGFKTSSINLISGEAGSGKSILAVHFLLAGIAEGETGLYVSIEENKSKFLENMSRFGFQLDKLESEEKFIFDKLEAEEKFIFYEVKPREIRDFLSQGFLGFEEHLKKGKVKRIVLDSITAFLILFDGESAKREAMLALIEKLEKSGLTVLFTSETEENQSRFNIDYLVDGIIRLNYRKVSNERVRTIEVMKMRGTNHSKREVMYRIENKGIVLYPKEGVF